MLTNSQVRPVHIRLYKFIDKFMDKKGFAPLYEDIEGKVEGINSMPTYYRLLKDLEAFGSVQRVPNTRYGLIGVTGKLPSNKSLIKS